MALKCGILGLPNVGKSTLFNAITEAGAEMANYPFCTIDPNIGVVSVNDKRLNELGSLYNTKKLIETSYEFVDIAGLVEGASRGEGLGNKFLSHIREVDALAHVVRCFIDDDISHVSGNVSPKRDIEIINYELILADLDSMEKRMTKLKSKIKTKDKEALFEHDLVAKVIATLEDSKGVRSMDLTPEEKKVLKNFSLLTAKPIIYIANVKEEDILKDSLPLVEEVSSIAASENTKVIKISAKIESEIAELPKEDRNDFLNDLGLLNSGLDEIIRATYSLLGLITYFTAGEKETRAWTIKNGTKAPGAAGAIHTDFEKGFIKAEVISWEDLLKFGSEAKAKEAGMLRIEGKDYIVKDGDVMHFRFNV